MTDKSSRAATAAGVAGTGVVALAVACCATAPLIAGLAGSIAIGTVLGVGVGVAVALAVIFALVALRRRGCRSSAERERG